MSLLNRLLVPTSPNEIQTCQGLSRPEHAHILPEISLPKADGMPGLSSWANKKRDELDTYLTGTWH